jgi:small subunit ribosomal protein S8
MKDILADALTEIKNAEKIGRAQCTIKPVSNLLRSVLSVIRTEGYVGDFEVIDNGRGGVLVLNLLGKINKCGAIKPRFSVKTTNFEKFEKRYLPAKGFGMLIISTTKGIMTNEQAKELGMGGQLLAYVY